MLHQLIYSSRSTDQFDVDKIDHFLGNIRAENQRLDVTGMLLFDGHSFLQVLEGDKETVSALYATILKDPRHQAVTHLFDSPVAKRHFPDWTMGFSQVVPGQFDHLTGLNDFEFDFTYLNQVDYGRAKKILSAFSKGAWH